MRIVLRRTTMVNLIVLAIASATAVAQRPAAPQGTPADATARIVKAAQAVLATLDEAGRAKVQFPFDGPQKTRWSNLPSRHVPAPGPALADLTPPQRAAVMTLLTDGTQPGRVPQGHRDHARRRSAEDGTRRARGAAAAAGGARRPGSFGEDEYYLAFLGTPSTTTPWMLQFGGHHLAINLTMAGSQATMAPSFRRRSPRRTRSRAARFVRSARRTTRRSR